MVRSPTALRSIAPVGLSGVARSAEGIRSTFRIRGARPACLEAANDVQPVPTRYVPTPFPSKRPPPFPSVYAITMKRCLFTLLFAVDLLLASMTPSHAVAMNDLPSRPIADDPRFSLAELSPKFVGNSDAVLRLDEHTLEIHSTDDATYRVRRAVTVFSKEGRDYGQLVLTYDEFREIDDLDGWIRDESGKVIRNLDDSDVADYAGSGGGTMYSDSRIRVATLTHSSYPYTVEFEYEMEYDGYFTLPTWYPQSSRDLPVERAYFTLIAEDADDIRHTVRNGPLEVESSTDDGTTTTTWSMILKHAESSAPYGPDWPSIAPSLHIAPSFFEISGTEGQLRTWDDFGAWLHDLYTGRQVLPADLERKVDAIASRASSERELIQRLFELMQDRTRYISVQLGIGGWQPFSAEYVHERGYGDCKALTNYVWAMLKHVDIEAYPVAIYRDRSPSPLLEDFPSNQFNHIILAVPVEQDTLWLEATSQTIPFGHVHSGIEDRPALLIKPNGGELVQMPASMPEDNRQVRTARVELTAKGHANVRLQTLKTGAQTDRQRLVLKSPTPEKISDWAQQTISAPSVQITGTDISQVGTRQREVETTVEAHLPRLASSTGARLFVPVNLSSFSPSIPSPATEPRDQPVYMSPFPWSDVDSTTFVLPDGYALEALPDSASIDTKAGSFQAYLTDNGNGTVTYVRRIRYAEDVLPPSAYDAFRDLTRSISRNSRQQMVLVKN